MIARGGSKNIDMKRAFSIQLRILIILGTKLNLGGGMEYYFKDLASFLAPRYDITIVEAESGPEYTNLKGHFHGVKIVSLGNRSGYDLPSISDFVKLRKLFIQNDVVYYHSGAWNIVYSVLLQYLTGTPVLGISWFLTDAAKRFEKENKSRSDSPKTRFATIVFGPSLIRLGRFFKRYQVVSHEDYVFLTNLWKDNQKVREITFGIDTKRYKTCQKEDKFTILYLARLDYQKGADRLPELVKLLNARIEDFNFQIVGDGPFMPQIKTLEHSYKNVQVLGYVSKETEWDKYSRFLCGAHVFLSPIRYAGTTIIALETLASGTPVVEFESTGTKERITDGYNGFKVHSVTKMVDKVFEIHRKWTKGDGYDQMVKNATISVKRFELQDKFHQVENLLIETSVTRKKRTV